jgi:hypothetical protein
MTIEIFTGGRRSFRGEGAVLTVIEGILRAQGEDAVILRNVRVVVPNAETKRTAEVDLFVATASQRSSVKTEDVTLYGGPKVTPLPSAPAAAVQQQPALPLPPCPKGHRPIRVRSGRGNR